MVVPSPVWDRACDRLANHWSRRPLNCPHARDGLSHRPPDDASDLGLCPDRDVLETPDPARFRTTRFRTTGFKSFRIDPALGLCKRTLLTAGAATGPGPR